jgi:hypothetical protein
MQLEGELENRDKGFEGLMRASSFCRLSSLG